MAYSTVSKKSGRTYYLHELTVTLKNTGKRQNDLLLCSRHSLWCTGRDPEREDGSREPPHWSSLS